MSGWTLIGEFYSLCFLILLFLRYHWDGQGHTHDSRQLLFIRCLLLSIGSIVLNVVCVLLLDRPGLAPAWVNMGLNTLYFLVCIFACSMFAFLLFDAILEHVYDKHCLRRAIIVLAAVTGISVALLLANLFTGVLFYIDAAGAYCRGPLNSVYYLLPVVEGIFLVVCYVRNRRSVGDRMLYVMRSVPPIILLLCVLQFSFPAVLLNGTLCAVISLIIFISFRSHTDEQDALTGAGSRGAFLKEMGLRTDSGQKVHIIQICVLNMADVNLRHGHDTGSALLYEICRYLRHFHSAARVYRTGNTTFCLILPLESEAGADANIQALQLRLNADWQMGDTHCQPTFSLAELRSDNLTGTATQIIERLEYASQLARRKQTTVRFDREVAQQFHCRANRIELIQRSIEEGRFRVVFQPMYCCLDDLFCSAEALLRLSDWDGTPISPDIFIPLAEEAGLMDRLTWIVLEQVCQTLQREDLPGLKYICMNLSMRQFLDPRLPRQMAEYLQRYRIDPSRLRVEITERFILHDAEYAANQLCALQELGILIHMDDFGTGYSNLSSVLNYPLTMVKLDRSLVAPICQNRQARLMVSTLLSLFHQLNMRVVAEGVEEEDQVHSLRELGVDMIQGFYYAKPMPADKLPPYFQV